MKLLIVTQVMDTEHPILGFFHRWVEEFAKHCEQVHVICLQEGRHNLPENVTVYSLGKESGVSRVKYLVRFYRLIFSLRNEYDQVFVHMNQIYVILGGWLWHMWRKKVGLWYMHGSVPFTLKIAEKIVDVIFTGSPESFRLPSEKLIITGHGIDTMHFKPLPEIEKDLDLITVGRITPSKNLETLIELFAEVRKEKNATLTIVGGAVSEQERSHENLLKDKVKELKLEDSVTFLGRVNQTDLPEVLNRSKLFVTVAQNGSLDKAVLEAMACGIQVLSMASGTVSLGLGEWQVERREDFKGKVLGSQRENHLLSEGNIKKVFEHHSLSSLIPRVLGYLVK